MRMDERRVVAEIQRVSLRELRLWIREGWVRPAQSTDGPVFDEIDIARIRLLCDLKKEMDLPSETLPVVLSLIDHLHETRRHFRQLMNALDAQPEAVRRDVMARFGSMQPRSGPQEDDH